jgi:hypothetical protein
MGRKMKPKTLTLFMMAIVLGLAIAYTPSLILTREAAYSPAAELMGAPPLPGGEDQAGVKSQTAIGPEGLSTFIGLLTAVMSGVIVASSAYYLSKRYVGRVGT